MAAALSLPSHHEQAPAAMDTDAEAVGIAYWQYIWRHDAVLRPHSPVDLEVHAQPGGEYTVMYAWQRAELTEHE